MSTLCLQIMYSKVCIIYPKIHCLMPDVSGSQGRRNHLCVAFLQRADHAVERAVGLLHAPLVVVPSIQTPCEVHFSSVKQFHIA